VKRDRPIYYILAEDGRTPKPVDSLEEALPFMIEQGGVSVQVAEDRVGDVRVSTIFLGIDGRVSAEPMLFETMVFGGPLDHERRRYTTWDEAEAGHAEVLADVWRKARH
jgi:hypothetical protein